MAENTNEVGYLDKIGLTYYTQKVKSQLADKQAILSGTVNDIVSFDESGNAVAVNYDILIPKSVQITLPIDGWSSNEQTVTVEGVSDDPEKQMIIPVPSEDSMFSYMNAQTLCIHQDENSLTFSVEDIPSKDLKVYIFIQNVMS